MAYLYETALAQKVFKDNRSFFKIPVYSDALIVNYQTPQAGSIHE
jgi:hypothetical protein